jgi:hypothetical protein
MTTAKNFLFCSMFALTGLLTGCAGEGADGDLGSTGGTGGSSNSTNTGNNTSKTGGNNNTGNNNNTGGSSNTSSTGGSSGTSSGSGIVTVGGYLKVGDLGGYFFTAADAKGSTISPKDFAVNGKLCVSGSAAVVVAEAYDTTWGAILGWNVKQAAMEPNPPESVALSANGTFSITLTGTVPDGTRFKTAVGGKDYCTTLSSGANTVKMSSLTKECWTSGGAAYAGEPVKDVGIQISTNGTSAKPFDFCLTAFEYKP